MSLALRIARWLSACLCGAACCCAGIARAWDSRCNAYPDGTLDAPQLGTALGPCEAEPGPYAAQGRFRSSKGGDEHAQIFRAALAAIGVDPAALRWRVDVFTADKPAGSRLRPGLKSVAPVRFPAAELVQRRAFDVDELTMLPDFSYSLADWVTGNETCPLRGYAATNPIACHTAKTHLGIANSNHFPPQADGWYLRLHGQALARASECVAVRAKIPSGELARFGDFLKECEIETLAIEAVAQHYLQDVWSSGHMWQRWGSAELDDYPDLSGIPEFFGDASLTSAEYKRQLAQVVGLTSGVVHGVEPIFPLLPDALCYPAADVDFAANGALSLAAGDVHLDDVLAARSVYRSQKEQLLGCATSSLLEVYDALGPEPLLGAAQLQAALALSSPANCLGARATNRALYHGVALDLSKTRRVYLSGLFARFVIVPVIASRPVFDDAGLRRYADDLLRLEKEARLRAEADAEGSDFADRLGSEGELLGVARNSAYPSQASYQDPALPWPGPAGSADTATPAQALARFFHRGHADDWCTQTGQPELNELRSAVSKVQDAGRDSNAVCRACTEIVARHVRIGSSERYDTASEPLCHYLAGVTAAIVYQSASATVATNEDAARAWCGCEACPTVKGVSDLTQVQIKEFQVTPSSIGSGASFNVHWLIEANARSGSFGTVAFHVNNVASLQPGFVDAGMSATGLTRVFQAALPQQGSNTLHDDETKNCSRVKGLGTDSLLCGTSGLTLLVPLGQPAFGLLNACVSCSLSAASLCKQKSVPLVFP